MGFLLGKKKEIILKYLHVLNQIFILDLHTTLNMLSLSKSWKKFRGFFPFLFLKSFIWQCGNCMYFVQHSATSVSFAIMGFWKGGLKNVKKKVFLKKQQVHFLGTMYFFVFFLKSSYLESFEICYIFCNTIEISFCLFTYNM